MLDEVARMLHTPSEVVALAFARMADALGNSMLVIALPILIAGRPAAALAGLPEEIQVGLVISLFGFLFALAQPVTGALGDRVGRRRSFVLAGLAVMALATLGFSRADSYLAIVALRGAQGMGVALVVSAVLALITLATETRNRGNAMGVYSTFRTVGFASCPLLGGLLLVRIGFDDVFFVGASFVLAALVLVHRTVREEGKVRRASAPRASLPAPRRLPSPSMLALMFSAVVLASFLSMIASLENVFNERLAQTALGFGAAFSVLTVSRLAVQIPLGRLSDRIGRKKPIVAGLVALAPITALFGHVGSTEQLVALRLLPGVATAGIAAPAFALAGDLAKEGSEGREMSLVAFGFGLGLAAGPLVTGALAGYLGFATPFYVFAGLALVAAATVWAVARESMPADPSSTARSVHGAGGEEPQVRRAGDRSFLGRC